MKRNLLKMMMLLVAVITIIVTGCKKEEFDIKDESSRESDINSNLAISNYLRNQGFDVSNIQDFDNYVMVENDIAFDKSALLLLAENVENSATLDFQLHSDGIEERQYVHNPDLLVSINNVQSIKYYIDNSVANIPNVGSFWVAAIHKACENWTLVQNCRITFVAVNSHAQANLSFFADNNSILPPALQNLPPNSQNSNQVIAAADWPVNGNVGRFISVNDATSGWSMNNANREKCMMHEIGHAFGLAHDNSAYASRIQGTPISDASSVMIQGLSENILSENDKKAAQFLYPDGYSAPQITGVVSSTNGNVNIQMPVPSGQLPYRAVVYRFTINGVYVQGSGVEFTNIGNQTNFQVPCPPGSWKFKMLYANYGSYTSSLSNEVIALNGLYELKRKGTTKCLDAANCGTSNSTNIQLWEDNNLECQRWIVSLQSDGFYELKRQNTDKNLDAASCGTSNGTNVQLWEDNSLDCQRWKITLESDGFFELKRKGTNKNLDASQCGTTNGTNVQLWEDNSLDCQRWGLTFF